MPSTNYSSQELVELSIEWTTRKNPDAFLVSSYPLFSFENLAMFDAKTSGLGSFDAIINPHLDLTATLERADAEDERCKFLQRLIAAEFKSAAKKKEVMALLDAELRSLGLTDTAGPSAEFSKKALAIAQARVMSKHNLTMADLNAEPISDFIVSVTRLRGGLAQTRNHINLFFNFNVQFSTVLEELRVATIHSVILPVNSQVLGNFDPVASTMGNTDEEISTFFNGGSFVTLSVRDAKVAGQGLEPLKAHTEQDSKEWKARGYTIEQGPWKWLNSSVKPRKWEDMADAVSFKKLIMYLRNHPGRNGDPPMVVFCHALDLEAINQWKEVEHENKATEQEWIKTMKERGFTSDELGGNFTDLWRREREEQDMSKDNNN